MLFAGKQAESAGLYCQNVKNSLRVTAIMTHFILNSVYGMKCVHADLSQSVKFDYLCVSNPAKSLSTIGSKQ